MNKNVKTFIYDWILKEWEQKGEPLVWESLSHAVASKSFSKMRLWEYIHGKHYIKNHTPQTKNIDNKWYTT